MIEARAIGRGEADSAGSKPLERLGWKTPLVVLLLYGVAIAGATYPRVSCMSTSLPGLRIDPLNHIWMMKWYRACLLGGKPFVFSPGLQHPIGFPLALNSPLMGQAGLFIPLSFAVGDDYLCYNILWFFAFLFTGMSMFALTWAVLRDRFAAGFGGLVGMLSTPIMMRGHGHLELMFAGSMGLFLACWVGWVDRPRRSGLLLSAIAYLASAVSAAYFALLAIVPAASYVAWRLVAVGRAGGLSSAGRWLADRAWWFAGFVGLVVPGLLLIFASQFWASARGLVMERPLSSFATYGTPAWSYVVPTSHHAASALKSYLPPDYSEGECGSYLGIATMLLLGYAAARRVSFPRAGFWWLTLATAVVLSLGAFAEVGSHRIPLPALWLRETVPLFRSLRAPSRFNLLACLIAGVIAAAGLRSILAGIRRPWARGLVGLGAVALVLGDMSMVPFWSDPNRPPMPQCYDWIKARKPGAAILEAPLLSSGCPHALTQTCAYWQSFHGLRTSSGYTSFINTAFDDLMVDHSPLSALTLFNPTALDHPGSISVGVVSDVGLRDYLWLVANRGGFDYILLHGWEESAGVLSPSYWKLAEALKETVAFAESKVLVYDASKIPRPGRPVLLCDEGMRVWRVDPKSPMRVIGRSGKITAFVPESAGPVVFSMEARAFRKARMITLRSGDSELARWDLGTSAVQTLSSPPLDLPAGLQALTITSDGVDAPSTPGEVPCEWDSRPYGLQILSIGLRAASKP